MRHIPFVFVAERTQLDSWSSSFSLLAPSQGGGSVEPVDQYGPVVRWDCFIPNRYCTRYCAACHTTAWGISEWCLTSRQKQTSCLMLLAYRVRTPALIESNHHFHRSNLCAKHATVLHNTTLRKKRTAGWSATDVDWSCWRVAVRHQPGRPHTTTIRLRRKPRPGRLIDDQYPDVRLADVVSRIYIV